MSSDLGDNEKKAESMEIEGDSNYYLEYASKGTKHLKATILICCPHTAYYEYLFYEVITLKFPFFDSLPE